MSWGQFGTSAWNFVDTLTRTAAWAVSTTISGVVYLVEVASGVLRLKVTGASSNSNLEITENSGSLQVTNGTDTARWNITSSGADLEAQSATTFSSVATDANNVTLTAHELGEGAGVTEALFQVHATAGVYAEFNDDDGGVLSSWTMGGSGHTFVGNVTVPSLKIKDSGNDHVITLDTASDEAADRTLTIPALGGNKTLACIDLAQTFTAQQIFEVGAAGASPLIARQTGGTASVDEVQLTHDGTQSYIKSLSGPLRAQMPADAAFEIVRDSAPTFPLISLYASSGTTAALIGYGGFLGIGPGAPSYTGNTFFLWGGGSQLGMASAVHITWSSTSSGHDTPDTGIKRIVAGVGAASDGSTGYGWWQTAGESRVASNVTNATTTMAAITGLSASVKAGRKYAGELVVKCSEDVAADGIKIDFDGGTATMTSFAAGAGVLTGGTTVVVNEVSSALATDLEWSTITGETWITIKFTFVVNAAGTFIPRMAQSAHTTGTATVALGTYMAIKDIP